MKKKMGRLICLSITASMALSSVPFTAMAENTLPGVTASANENTEGGEQAESKVTEGTVATIGDTEYSSLEEAIFKAVSGDTIKLHENATVDNLGTTVKEATFNGETKRINALEKSLTFDLNGNDMTYTGGTVTIYDEADGNNYVLEFMDSSVSEGERGGNLNFTGITASTNAVISPSKGTSLKVSDLNIYCSATGFFPYGNAAEVNIDNCYMKVNGVYCIGTNAGDQENYGVTINLTNSTFIADNTIDKVNKEDSGDDCTILINVGGKLNIDNCYITGNRQAVVVRAGDANITNSNITVTGNSAYSGNRLEGAWSSGNEVAPGALVVGNYVDGEASAYKAAADVNVSDTIITSENSGVPAIYADSNKSYESNIDITGASTVVTGTVETGQYNAGHESSKTSDINIYAGKYLTKDGNPNTAVESYIEAANSEIDSETGTIIANKNAVAQIPNKGAYDTLKAALEAAEDGDTVTLLKNVTIDTAEASAAIDAGVTLVVPSGITFKVSETGAAGLLNSKGKVEVNAGGIVSLPTAEGSNENWIGNSDTDRINLESGTIVSDFAKGTLTLTTGSKASVPAGQTYYLHLTSDKPISGVIEDGAEFIVNGIFKAVAGSHITIEEGGIFTVAEKGTYEERTNTTEGTINVKGTAYIFIKAANDTVGTYNIIENGAVYDANGILTADDGGNVISGTDSYEVVSETVDITYPDPEDYPTDSTYPTNFTSLWTIQPTIAVSIVDNSTGDAVETPKEGQTLRADVTTVYNNENAENVTYIWYYSDDTEKTPLSQSATCELTEESVGKEICVDITYGKKTETHNVGTAEAIEEYTVSADTVENGTITITADTDGDYSFKNGTDVSYTVKANEGYVIESVSINGSAIAIESNLNEYNGTISEISADTTISAEFAEEQTEEPEPSKDPSVLLSQTSGQVEVKGTLNITEYITNESKNTFKEFTYESEYTEYATVDENGVVTGVKETDGVDIIVTGKGIASNADYTTSTAFNLEVVAKDEPTEPEEPTELSLELVENSGSVRVGREFSLASDEYIKDFEKFTAGFTYSSNDTSIATVDGNGLVKGVNRGSTTINIIANESDDYTLTTSHAAFTLNVTRSSNGEDSSSSSSGGGGGSSSSSGYSVSTSSSDNGSFTVDKDRASSGSTVTITANPDEGYEVGKVTVTDADGNEITVRDKGNNQYTFTMPSSRVTIDVEFVESETTEEVTEPSEETTMPFTDVDENDWFYDAVKYAYENELMSGTALDTFSPDTNTTRGMIVSILYRLEGSPAITERAAFTDVESGQYYADAVAWAAANGIVSGYDAFTFGPNDNITREQMASILYRYAQYKGIDTSAAGNLAAFSDNASISAYARTAISWAVGEGLVSGMGDGTLAPQGQATRAQVASILMRFAQM